MMPVDRTPDPKGKDVAFSLELFVAGGTALSRLARTNLEAMLAELRLQHAPLRVVDVLDEPLVALSRRIFVTPTLIISRQNKQQMIVGDLTDRAFTLASLGSLGGQPKPDAI